MAMRTSLQRPLQKPLGFVDEAGRMFSVGLEAMHTVFRRPWPLEEFLQQMWFLIKVTTVPVILISIPFGMVISLHVGSFLRQLGAEAHMGAAMVLAVVREEAPVATALLIAGAGGSAMCADLGSRRIREEIDAMEVLGIDPVARLIMPRILAAMAVAILLDAIVSVAGIVGGWFFAVVVQHGTTSSYFNSAKNPGMPSGLLGSHNAARGLSARVDRAAPGASRAGLTLTSSPLIRTATLSNPRGEGPER
jgi:phospholipid/cholesterol/gamma-HCH transport system permease protein